VASPNGQQQSSPKDEELIQKMTRIRFLVGAMILVLSSASGFASPVEVDAIVGEWRHVKMIQKADGLVVRVQESHGESTMDFRRDGTWSLSSPTNSTSGSYRLIGKDSIETTILRSDKPNQIGFTSVKKVEFHEGTLELITIYDEKAMEAFAKRADGTRPRVMDIRSVFERIRQ